MVKSNHEPFIPTNLNDPMPRKLCAFVFCNHYMFGTAHRWYFLWTCSFFHQYKNFNLYKLQFLKIGKFFLQGVVTFNQWKSIWCLHFQSWRSLKGNTNTSTGNWNTTVISMVQPFILFSVLKSSVQAFSWFGTQIPVSNVAILIYFGHRREWINVSLD